MTDHYEEILDALAHEIWAAAQLAPGEGIVDGVDRIVALLRKGPHQAITHCGSCGCADSSQGEQAMTDRRSYWQRLKDHPGVPWATFMTIAGFFAGMNRGFLFAVLGACLAGGLYWGIVLWSNRSRTGGR
jgi:hypothetical protein